MYHFVAKGAMDLDGIGPKLIDQLMDTGLIKDAADLYSLIKEDFLNLDRFADKSAENAVASIQARTTVPLDRFIFALGIPHVGSETAMDLARKFSALGRPASGWGTLEQIAQATPENLNAIRDVGNVVAKSIYEWFQTSYHRKLLEKFKKVGLKILSQELAQKSNKLKNLTFVFTGSMNQMSRESAEALVRSHGGDASSSVSKTTSYVVVGAEPGSKAEKAKKLGIKIISEHEFLEMI
jgi:DNA ligase (NAD+)